ncbi:unnamed protein product [Periconia digitata]|uniref:Rhodopsin domain-containing protein n=1 Tax=Periconia digitata TaxID=1303443 RepID=A0A9W4UNA2_9PLEO|nr:unnamed protein product [Periconia digitata]
MDPTESPPIETSPIDSWIQNPAENNGPLMSVVTWCLVSVAGTCLATRLGIRQYQGQLWFDDATLVISWLLLLAQVIVNQLSINIGYGKHTLDLDFTKVDLMMVYGAAELTIYTVAIAMSKISFGISLLRLTKGWTRYIVCFAITTLAIFAIPATIIPWVQCKPLAKTFVDFLPGKCYNKKPSVKYGQFQAIWSAMMDLCLALLPWQIIWGLQMRLAEKIGVGVAMSLGIFAGATSIIRSTYIQKLTVQDVSYESYNAIIWATAECSMTIVAISIPVFRVFFKKAIQTARTGYSSSKSRSRTDPSNNASAHNRISIRQFSKKTPDTLISDNFSKKGFGSESQSYVQLDDLVINEQTQQRRATSSSSSDAQPDSSVRQIPTSPV